MPLPIMLAHKLVKGLSCARRDGVLDYLRPDGKSQVSVEYDNGRPVRVDTVVVSTQHSDLVSNETLRDDITAEDRRRASSPANMMDSEHPRPHQPDRPLRRRRSARRRRRHRPQDHRRHLRRRGAARRRRVLGQGSDEGRPLGLLHGALRRQERRRGRPRRQVPGAARLRDRRRRAGVGPASTPPAPARSTTSKLSEIVRGHFKLTPKGIIETLNLRRPIYKKTAAFGHFGRTEPEFTWERTDKADAHAQGCGRVNAVRLNDTQGGETDGGHRGRRFSLAASSRCRLVRRLRPASSPTRSGRERSPARFTCTARDPTGRATASAIAARGGARRAAVRGHHRPRRRHPDARSARLRRRRACASTPSRSAPTAATHRARHAAAPYPLGGEAAAVVEDVTRLGGMPVVAHPGLAKGRARLEGLGARQLAASSG